MAVTPTFSISPKIDSFVRSGMAKFKLIVVVGFSSSGKSTLMSNLYTHLSSGKVCAQNTKHEIVMCPLGQNPNANVYLGFDGDDRSCIDDNLDRIRNGQYDVAIITLSRASYTVTNTGKGWQKWIDDWLRRNQYPVPFDDYERYYVHTEVPMLYTAHVPLGQIATQPPPGDPRVPVLEKLIGDHIVDLLNLIV